MEENNNSVICVTGSMSYKLAVIDEKVKTPEEIYDKIIEEVLCDYPDYRFKENINPEEIVMCLITKKIAYLLEEPYYRGCPIKEFKHIFIIKTIDRELNWFELKETQTVADFIKSDVDYLLFDKVFLKNSFNINPYVPTLKRTDGWMCMSTKRPEQFDELIEPVDNQDGGLVNITKPLLVYYGGKYYIDKRRKFLNYKDWIWNNLEGLRGYSDSNKTFWRVLEPPVEE